MTKHTLLTALGAAAISLFAVSLAQAREMPSHKHAAKHVSSQTWRHSYARMPVESDAPQPYLMHSSPNAFEIGRAPGQPGPAH